MSNSLAKKIFAVGLAASTVVMSLAPLAAKAAANPAGTNVSDSTGTVYMITTDGYRRPYTSAGAFLSYGFNSWSGVKTASAEDLAKPVGSFIPPQDGKVLCSDRGADKGTCYLITNGMKAGFTSASVFTGLGFSFSRSAMADVSWMPSTSNIDNTTAAHRPGVLINDNGTVKLVGNSGVLGIPDLATFNGWGYSFADVVPANASDKAMAMTGVMAAHTAGALSPVAAAPGSTTPGTSSSVVATLSSDTPVSGTVVAGQSIADLAHFTFTGSGTVTKVVLKRIGVSADTTLANVYLYDGSKKLTDAGSVSNGMVTFSNSTGLFTVSGSKNISVKSDIVSGVSGQTVGVQLAGYTVGGSDVTVAISGNTMNTATVSNLATVQLTATPTGATGNVTAGTMSQTLWSGIFSVGQRAVSLRYVAFKQVGSIPSDALQNIKLMVAGNPVGSATSIDSNNNIIFDLSGSPVTMQTGNNTIEVRGDIVKGASRTFSLQLQTASDLVVVDPNFGVNIAVSLANGVSFPATPASTATVQQGSVSVQTDGAFTTTQLVKNSNNVTLGQWTMKAYGEDVKVQTLGVQLSFYDASGNATSTTATEGFNNLSLYVNGGMVGSSQNALATSSTGVFATTTFGTTNLFTIPAGTTVSVAVKGDMMLDSSTKVGQVKATLAVTAQSMQGNTSFNTFPSSAAAYASTQLTVVSASATLAKNGGYANPTIAPNSTNQKIGSYVIQANNAEGVRVTSLTVAVGGTLGTTNMANLYVKTPNATLTPVNPQASNNFSVDFTVPANQTATVDVFADFTNTTGTASTTMSGTGTGSNSGQSVTLSSTTGQTVTVGSGLVYTSYVTKTSASPVSQILVGGKTAQSVATFNIVSTSGAVTITELTFTASGTSVSNGDTPLVTVTAGGKSATMVSNSATLTGLSIAVPANYAGIDIPVTVDTAVVGLGGITSNKTVQLNLTAVKYTSGSTTTTINPTTTSRSNTMLVAGTKPTVVLSAVNGSLNTGTVKIGSVTVTADAAGNVVLNALPISVSTSGSVTLAAGSSAQIWVGGSQYTNISQTTFNSSGANTITFTGGYTIPAGTSVTFDIYATIGGTLGNAGSSAVNLSLGANTAFLWTDVTGNATGLDATYVTNYPSSSVSIHN